MNASFSQFFRKKKKVYPVEAPVQVFSTELWIDTVLAEENQ